MHYTVSDSPKETVVYDLPPVLLKYAVSGVDRYVCKIICIASVKVFTSVSRALYPSSRPQFSISTPPLHSGLYRALQQCSIPQFCRNVSNSHESTSGISNLANNSFKIRIMTDDVTILVAAISGHLKGRSYTTTKNRWLGDAACISPKMLDQFRSKMI